MTAADVKVSGENTFLQRRQANAKSGLSYRDLSKLLHKNKGIGIGLSFLLLLPLVLSIFLKALRISLVASLTNSDVRVKSSPKLLYI